MLRSKLSSLTAFKHLPSASRIFFAATARVAGAALATLNHPIYDLAFDAAGRLWASTGGGPLLELDPATGGIRNAYGDGVQLGLAVDDVNHRLFVSTARGVEIFDTETHQFQAFSKTRVDGLALAPAAPLLARLGCEPFDPALTPQRFHALLHARRAPVKAALLAGDIVVGAGNIYACEALFRAGIDPRTRCNALSRPRCERLLTEVRTVLARAIALGGSTLRDFRDAHGMSGAFQDEALVYGRAGQPCQRCGTPIRRLVQLQRSTYFCPHCQRR